MCVLSARLPVTIVVTFSLLFCLVCCTNVSRMQEAYEAGDTKQLQQLVKIVSRPDYPYATRKKAAEVLGDIGDPVALSALIAVLSEYDQRTTLKGAAMVSLGKIGDRSAVQPIGRLLDRSLSEPKSELRMAAIPILGQLGGSEAAVVLINALSYYDLMTLRDEQRSGSVKGAFTGDETDLRALRDSLRGPMELFGDGALGGGLLGDSNMPRITMFGTPMQNPGPIEKTTAQERSLAHKSLVKIGKPAISAIQTYLDDRNATTTLKKELLSIVEELKEVQNGEKSIQSGI